MKLNLKHALGVGLDNPGHSSVSYGRKLMNTVNAIFWVLLISGIFWAWFLSLTWLWLKYCGAE